MGKNLLVNVTFLLTPTSSLSYLSLFVSCVKQFTSTPFVREADPTGRGKTLRG